MLENVLSITSTVSEIHEIEEELSLVTVVAQINVIMCPWPK